MNILLIGSGAREHAIAKTLKRSKHSPIIYCCASNNNPGLLSLSNELVLKSNPSEILKYAHNKKINFAVIGPEAQLAAGLVDELTKNNIPCIGPSKLLAQIETSKGLARNLMQEFDIPGQPQYQYFNKANKETEHFLKSLNNHYVIKADGLCSGKGVKLSGEHLRSLEDAMDYCHSIQGPFVIEEKLSGAEFSLISFSDGFTVKSMPPVQDHKRAFKADTGPNTGGMGSYTCETHLLPFLTQTDIQQAQRINQATIDALYEKYNQRYIGFLYGGFMKTKSGINLIEYNARLGDPEAINLLHLLKTDLVDICLAMLSGKLKDLPIEFSTQATVVKYLVPDGYPIGKPKNLSIDYSQANLNSLYFAGLNQNQQGTVMTGSRALAVLGTGNSLAEAEQEAEHHAKQVTGDLHYRSDIGTPALYNKHVSFLNE